MSDLLWSMLLVVLTGAGALLLRGTLRSAGERLAPQSDEGVSQHVSRRAARLAMAFVPVAAFFLAYHLLLSLLVPAGWAGLVATVVIETLTLVALVVGFGRALLAPRMPRFRLIPVPDGAAQFVHMWLVRLALVGLVGNGLLGALRDVGTDPAAVLLQEKLFGVVLAVLACVLIRQIRNQAAGRLAGATGPVSPLAAEIWHVFLMLYVMGLGTVWLAGLVDARGLLMQGVPAFAAILAAAFAAETAVGRALGRLRGPETDGPAPRSGAQ